MQFRSQNSCPSKIQVLHYFNEINQDKLNIEITLKSQQTFSSLESSAALHKKWIKKSPSKLGLFGAVVLSLIIIIYCIIMTLYAYYYFQTSCWKIIFLVWSLMPCSHEATRGICLILL